MTRNHLLHSSEQQKKEANLQYSGVKENGCLLCRMRTNFFVTLAQLVVHSLVAFLAFICACILSVGFKELCESIEKRYPTYVKQAGYE